MKIIDIDFNDGIKITYIDNTNQMIQVHFDTDVLSYVFGGSNAFNTKEK